MIRKKWKMKAPKYHAASSSSADRPPYPPPNEETAALVVDTPAPVANPAVPMPAVLPTFLVVPGELLPTGANVLLAPLLLSLLFPTVPPTPPPIAAPRMMMTTTTIAIIPLRLLYHGRLGCSGVMGGGSAAGPYSSFWRRS